MGFRKIRTIQVSERVFDLVCEELDLEASENYIKIDGYLECFNNCREQGYVLHVSSYDWDNQDRTRESLYVWACESRNSDNIMVIWSNEYPINGMFHEDDYSKRRKYFHYNELQETASFIIKLVKETFNREFN